MQFNYSKMYSSYAADVPPKKPEESEQQTYDVFVDIANKVFKVLIQRQDIAACHRVGKVIATYFVHLQDLSAGLVQLRM